VRNLDPAKVGYGSFASIFAMSASSPLIPWERRKSGHSITSNSGHIRTSPPSFRQARLAQTVCQVLAVRSKLVGFGEKEGGHRKVGP
jgi:hypothetical protein